MLLEFVCNQSAMFPCVWCVLERVCVWKVFAGLYVSVPLVSQGAWHLQAQM